MRSPGVVQFGLKQGMQRSLILGMGLNSVADLAIFDLGCNCNNVSWQHLGISPVKGMVFIPSLLSSEVFCRLHLGGWPISILALSNASLRVALAGVRSVRKLSAYIFQRI